MLGVGVFRFGPVDGSGVGSGCNIRYRSPECGFQPLAVSTPPDFRSQSVRRGT